MRKENGRIIYSPSDLIRYLASPYASWLDRYYVENPGAITPDEDTEEDKLLQRTGDEHERSYGAARVDDVPAQQCDRSAAGAVGVDGVFGAGVGDEEAHAAGHHGTNARRA